MPDEGFRKWLGVQYEHMEDGHAVVAVDTTLTPHDLLGVAHAIEAAAERVRAVRWGPRTLDVDVLLVGDERVDAPDLVVPHPRLHERAFVVVPLADLELSVRARNCLDSANLQTLRDLVTMNESEVMKLKNLGKTSLTEIKNRLAERGLSLGMAVSQ